VLTLEAAGLGLMTIGGWLGGTLVYRNFIGPDHRYANAGKWKEQRFDAEPGRPVAVADDEALEVDQMMLVHINGRRIVVARTADGYTAFDDHCTHRGASLADGVLICGKVQCLWHGSRFDVRSGAVENGPADMPIGVYQVQSKDGQVWLTV
jgi:nitrite reductase/ring-hydroxylating ferredoxin subunit